MNAPNADDRAFREAIQADPDDDTARLVYADWLEEGGDVRGELFRLLTQLPTAEKEIKSEIVQRIDSIAEETWQQFRNEWPQLSHLFRHVEYKQQFPELDFSADLQSVRGDGNAFAKLSSTQRRVLEEELPELRYLEVNLRDENGDIVEMPAGTLSNLYHLSQRIIGRHCGEESEDGGYDALRIHNLSDEQYRREYHTLFAFAGTSISLHCATYRNFDHWVQWIFSASINEINRHLTSIYIDDDLTESEAENALRFAENHGLEMRIKMVNLGHYDCVDNLNAIKKFLQIAEEVHATTFVIPSLTDLDFLQNAAEKLHTDRIELCIKENDRIENIAAYRAQHPLLFQKIFVLTIDTILGEKDFSEFCNSQYGALQELNCSHVLIVLEDMLPLLRSKSWESIRMEDCEIQDEELQQLIDENIIPRISRLYLNDNPLSEKVIRLLAQTIGMNYEQYAIEQLVQELGGKGIHVSVPSR